MIVTGTQQHNALCSQTIVFDGIKQNDPILFGVKEGIADTKFGSYTFSVPFRVIVKEKTTLSIPLSLVFCVSQKDLDILMEGLTNGGGAFVINSWRARVILTGELSTSTLLQVIPPQDIDQSSIIQSVQDAAFEGDTFSPHPLPYSLAVSQSVSQSVSSCWKRDLLEPTRFGSCDSRSTSFS